MEATVSEDALPAEALTQLPDEALMAMIAQDDEQALGALYDRYGRLVYSLALHITDDLVTAEQVTLDVFQRLWTAADVFRASCSDHGWIIAITRQYAVTVLRRQQNAPSRSRGRQ